MIQHLTVRGNNRRPIFLDDVDHHGFLAACGRVTEEQEWRVLAYCLMPNHVHLVLGADTPRISAGMRDLLGTYARRFHRRHGTSGHLFGGRFHNVPVEDDRQVAAVVRYVATNPVRAGLCERPADWMWSSYAASVGDRDAPRFLDLTWLWALLGRDPEVARAHIRALMLQP